MMPMTSCFFRSIRGGARILLVQPWIASVSNVAAISQDFHPMLRFLQNADAVTILSSAETTIDLTADIFWRHQSLKSSKSNSKVSIAQKDSSLRPSC
jgi:hypothetical protein